MIKYKLSEDWKEEIFSEAIEVNPKRELKKGIEAKFVSMSEIKEFDKRIQRYTIKKFSGGSKFINGDTLMARITPCLENGKTAFVDILNDEEVGSGSTEFIVLSAKKGKTIPHFVYYTAISTEIKKTAIKSMTGTSGRQRVENDIFNKISIALPPIQEQEAISNILKALDDKIALNRSMNSTLEAIGQALFRRWFVDFEFPDGEGMPYRSSGGEMVETELGEVPKGWRVGTLGEYVNIIKGCSYRSEDLQDSDKALITLKAIERGGGFKLDGLKPYTGEYKQEQIISPGELVVAHTDLTQKAEVLGKPAIVRKVPLYSTLIASLDLSVVRPKNDSTNVPFVYFLLKTEDFQNHAYGYAGGTTVLHLNKKAVPDYTFVIPQKDLIKKFGYIIIGLLNEIQNNELESDVLISVRDALLPKLMSGEIRIKNVNKSAQEAFTC